MWLGWGRVWCVARLGEGMVFGKVRDVLVFVWEIGQCLDGSGRVTDTPNHVLPHSLTSPSPPDPLTSPSPRSEGDQILQPNLQLPYPNQIKSKTEIRASNIQNCLRIRTNLPL